MSLRIAKQKNLPFSGENILAGAPLLLLIGEIEDSLVVRHLQASST
jgi:hypothetical protein